MKSSLSNEVKPTIDGVVHVSRFTEPLRLAKALVPRWASPSLAPLPLHENSSRTFSDPQTRHQVSLHTQQWQLQREYSQLFWPPVICECTVELTDISRTAPTKSDILVPETLLKKRKSQERAREERALATKEKRGT